MTENAERINGARILSRLDAEFPALGSAFRDLLKERIYDFACEIVADLENVCKAISDERAQIAQEIPAQETTQDDITEDDITEDDITEDDINEYYDSYERVDDPPDDEGY